MPDFPISSIRRQLGELSVLATQTDAMERKILARAEELLAEVEAKIEPAPTASASDPDAYSEVIEERGRLPQVIAQARAMLAEESGD